jgi:hypothetical protein
MNQKVKPNSIGPYFIHLKPVLTIWIDMHSSEEDNQTIYGKLMVVLDLDDNVKQITSSGYPFGIFNRE